MKVVREAGEDKLVNQVQEMIAGGSYAVSDNFFNGIKITKEEVGNTVIIVEGRRFEVVLNEVL